MLGMICGLRFNDNTLYDKIGKNTTSIEKTNQIFNCVIFISRKFNCLGAKVTLYINIKQTKSPFINIKLKLPSVENYYGIRDRCIFFAVLECN